MLTLISDPMFARMFKVSFVALAASASFFSCTSGSGRMDDKFGDNDEISGPTFTTTLVLRDSAGTERSTFQRGELITFELSVRNRTSQSADVSLSSTLAANFYVFPNGGSIALWSCADGSAFPTVITTLTFAANETKVMQCTWNQELSDGSTLPFGNYEARGIVAAVGVSPLPANQHELASTLRPFRVN